MQLRSFAPLDSRDGCPHMVLLACLRLFTDGSFLIFRLTTSLTL